MIGGDGVYARVIVEIGVKAVDRLFTYLVPNIMRDKIKVGARVKVLFGKQLLEGFVLELSDVCEVEYELKEIIELVDEEPILNEEMLWLGSEISKRTLCSKISAYQVMLPKALKAQKGTIINVKKDKYIKLGINIDSFDKTSWLYDSTVLTINKKKGTGKSTTWLKTPSNFTNMTDTSGQKVDWSKWTLSSDYPKLAWIDASENQRNN